MSAPLVTIVVPLYNYERYIDECLSSAVGQTWQPLEIIVVNDGSTDGGGDKARAFVEQGVRVVDQDNQGTVAAVNRGIAESRGEYVAWLSADDRFAPHKIERQMQLFERDPGLGCVFSNVRWHADTEMALAWSPLPREEALRRLRTDGRVEWETHFAPADSSEVLGRLLQTTLLVYLGSSLIPRRVFDEFGLLRPEYRRSHDYEFAMRLAAAGQRFAMLDEPLTTCRAHAGNTPYWGEIRDDENRVRRQYLQSCSLEQFYPRLAAADCVEAEKARLLAEHVRWLIHHGMVEEARDVYERKVKGQVPGEWSLELGKAWMGADVYECALAEFEKAVRFDPASMMAWYLQGDAYRAGGKLGPAVNSYLQGLRRAVLGR
jgi:glycosyltransferase involved in cell wall biosynthesis